MATILVNSYLLTYDDGGRYFYAHNQQGRIVHVRDSVDYTKDNPLTAEFLATNPDLSDRPDLAEPPPQEPVTVEEEG